MEAQTGRGHSATPQELLCRLQQAKLQLPSTRKVGVLGRVLRNHYSRRKSQIKMIPALIIGGLLLGYFLGYVAAKADARNARNKRDIS